MRITILSMVVILCAVACFAAPENLLTNAGFENSLTDWTHGFDGRAKIVTNVVHSGEKSAQISVNGQNCALDHAQLSFGPDLSLGAQYQASAWMRSGGIEHGNFGARLYFFDADGAIAGMMSFGGMVAGTPSLDWQHYSFSFGAGTGNPIPTGAASMKIRFSIWSPDDKSIGTVWVDDVALVKVKVPVAQALPQWMRWSGNGTAIVLKDDLPVTGGTASNPDALAAILAETGMAVNIVTVAQLAEAGVLNPDYVDLVVLPYAEAFPIQASTAFLEYANGGGSFVSLGGLAFDSLYQKIGGTWADVSKSVSASEGAAMVADFERSLPTWDFTHSDLPDSMSVEYVKPGGDGTAAAAKLYVENLTGWNYAGLTTTAPDPAHDYLCFWAKGDEATQSLAIELNEGDGSRWKYVVPLSEEWQWFEISVRKFASYATEGRGGPGDYLHAERTKIALFGFTKSMVGSGAHNLYIDEVQWRKPLVGNGVTLGAMRIDPASDMAADAFGRDLLAASGNAAAQLPIFTPPVEITGAATVRVNWPPALVGEELVGDFSGYLATQPSWDELHPQSGKSERSSLKMGSNRIERQVTLLEAFDATGNSLGPVGTLWIPHSPTANPGVWAYFGVANVDIAQADFFAPMLGQIADFAKNRPRIKDASLNFLAAAEAATSILQVELSGQNIDDAGLNIVVAVVGDGETKPTITLPVTASKNIEIPLNDLPATSRDYKVTITLQAGGDTFDELALRVNVRDTLIQVCNWLLDEQDEDGLFGGLFFEENRAVRGLLGAWEITGDERYRDAAIRWGEAQIEHQRDDGGYRMGYGIGSTGESCYVADGGEIAIAMGRLISYTSGDQQQRLIQSLRQYFAYRESFRQESGAIGVGWCLHDYGKRPILPLDKPTRIFAGEMNAYTIGCSLAAATAYAQITGDPADMAMVQRDTQWFVDNYTSYTGAGAESAIWAYHYTADDAMKVRLVEELNEGFRARMINPANTGWLDGGGRAVLDLDFITYWLEHMGPDPQMEAALGRWLFALCEPSSPSSIGRLTERAKVTATERRFISFAAVALADAAQPMVSMKPFESVPVK